MITTDQFSRTGRRVIDLRQPARGVAAQSSHPWRVSYSDGTATVNSGLRTVVGGASSIEPTAPSVDATGPAWIVKQYCSTLGQWIEGVQSIAVDPVDDAVANEINFEDKFFKVFPDTLARQRRVLAYISSEGAITQYAFGTIYAVGNPDDESEPGGGADVPEDDADAADRCNQNDHPGDEDYGGGEGGGEDQDDDDHPGAGEDGDQDDDDHPGAQDCYTTR